MWTDRCRVLKWHFKKSCSLRNSASWPGRRYLSIYSMLTQVVCNAPWDSCSAAFCESGRAIDSEKYYYALCLEEMTSRISWLIYKHYEGGLTNPQDSSLETNILKKKRRSFIIILLQVQDGLILLRVKTKNAQLVCKCHVLELETQIHSVQNHRLTVSLTLVFMIWTNKTYIRPRCQG